RGAGLHAPADLPLDRAAAGLPRLPAGAEQQPGEPGEDHHPGLCHRGAGDALHGQPDLVGLGERAGDDDLPAGRLRVPGRRAGVGHAQGGAGHAAARLRRMSAPLRPKARERRSLNGTTDLPVLLPVTPRAPLGAPRLTLGHGALLLALLLVSAGLTHAQAEAPRRSALAALLDWAPLLLEGFVFNIAISFLAMAFGTAVGAVLGLMQISLLPPVRAGSWLVTQFFRNAPWLVLLFFCMFLLPFEFTVAGVVIPFPDWVKATFGLSLPVMANVSEVVRGAVVSLPSGQWEAAESLAFSRRQTLWEIILPQCVK